MPSIDSQNQKTFTYSRSTLERAERALVCSPFNPCLFETMRSRRVALSEMTASAGVQNGYTKHSISELVADNALVWLIQVGVLRREVEDLRRAVVGGDEDQDAVRRRHLDRRLEEADQDEEGDQYNVE